MSNSNNLKFPNGRPVKKVKQDAKALKKQLGITLTEALHKCAIQNGIDLPWREALRTLKQDTSISLPLFSSAHEEKYSLIKPQLRLDGTCTVGMILGASGCGKSVMAADYIELALEAGYQVQLLDLVYDFNGLHNNGIQHPVDLAATKILQLKAKFSGQLHFISPNEPLMSAQDKSLFVMDDCASIKWHPNKTEFYDRLNHYLASNGKVLFVEQNEASIPNEVIQQVSEEQFGFITVSGYSYKTAIKLPYPKDLNSLVIKNESGFMPWITFSHKGISIGYHTAQSLCR